MTLRIWSLLIILGSFALSACVPDSDLSGFEQPPQTFLSVSTDGVGGITSATSYSSSAITTALPGYTVEGITTAEETGTQRALGVFREGVQVLQVFKGSGQSIRAIHGVTLHMVGPNNERIGMTFAQSGLSTSDCRVGRSLWRGMAICSSRGAENVKLVFAVSQYQGPYDRLPAPDQLREAELQRIVWTPAS